MRVFSETNESSKQSVREGFAVIIEAYIVETPASIADDRVNATGGDKLKARSHHRKVYVQHWIPIKNARRRTGAVYCPRSLYAGWVSVEMNQLIRISQTANQLGVLTF
jgi:hypothetical protein